MPALSDERLRVLLSPYLDQAPPPNEGLQRRNATDLYPLLGAYLDVLLKWNARTNLTSVRDPEAIAQRHFGESLFAGLQLGPFLLDGARVLDLGSGAGFPGIPIQLLYPGITVTLAESQSKKSAFLREVVRALGLPSVVWAGRVETMPPGTCFDAVTLRAVDRMAEMVQVGWARVQDRGVLLQMTVRGAEDDVSVAIPGTSDRVVALRTRA